MAQSVDLQTFQQLHATDLMRLLLAMEDTSFSSAVLRSFRSRTSVYNPRSQPAGPARNVYVIVTIIQIIERIIAVRREGGKERTQKNGARRVWPRRVGLKRAQTWKKWGRVGPRRVGPRRVGPKISRFFSLSRHIFLSSFSAGSFRGILVVF